MYAVGYEVYHHPQFSLTGLHNTVCKCNLINFNQYNLRAYRPAFFVTMYCFVLPFCKAKFCGVPSEAIVKVGCAVGKKKKVAEHCIKARPSTAEDLGPHSSFLIDPRIAVL
jgi:hypothetical protein